MKKRSRFSILISGCIFCYVFSYATPTDLSGYWEGQISYQEKKWNVGIEISRTASGSHTVLVDFLEIGAYNRLFTLHQPNDSAIRIERVQPDGRPPIIFNGALENDILKGSWEGIGIKNASFALRRAVKFTYTTEEVVFRNDSVTLSGTLLLPNSPIRHRAIVFMHGGAPEDRNVSYGAAVKMVQHGIAALVYDKRGVGKSKGGDWRTAGITGLAKDALAAVALLKQRSDIDQSGIGVFGHSEGGWTAPMAATLSSDIAFVIVSGASGVNATEQSVYQRASILRENGFSDSVIQKASAIRERMNRATELCFTDTIAAKKALEKSAVETAACKNEPWFSAAALPAILYTGCPETPVMEMLFKKPETIWEKVKVPVYAVWGSDDIVVPIHKRNIIENTLAKNGHTSLVTKLIPGVTHFILYSRKTDEWDFPREPEQYFTDMAVWIKSLHLPKKSEISTACSY